MKVTAINLSIIIRRKPTPVSVPVTIQFAPNWTDLHTQTNMIPVFFSVFHWHFRFYTWSWRMIVFSKQYYNNYSTYVKYLIKSNSTTFMFYGWLKKIIIVYKWRYNTFNDDVLLRSQQGCIWGGSKGSGPASPKKISSVGVFIFHSKL